MNAISELLSIIFQGDMVIADSQGNTYPLSYLQKDDPKKIWNLTRKTDQRQYLQKNLVNSIYVGTTSRFICFVEASCILHLFSVNHPY